MLAAKSNSRAVVQRDCYYLVEKSGIRGVRNQDVQGQEGGVGSTAAGAAAAAQHGEVGGAAALSAGPTAAGALPAHPNTDVRLFAAAEMPHHQLPAQQAGGGTRSPDPGMVRSWQGLPVVQQHAALDVRQCGDTAAASCNDLTGQHAHLRAAIL